MSDAHSVGKSRLRALMQRLLQFRLRTLLVLVAVAAVLLATVGRHYWLERRHAAAIVAIAEAGGVAANENGKVAREGEPIVRVHLRAIDDHKLQRLVPHLSYLPRLRELDVVDSPVTDRGLAAVGSLSRLESLYVYNLQITPAGLKSLAQRLPHVKIHEEEPDPIATSLVVRTTYRHAVPALDISPDGRLLAAGDGRGMLWLWQLDSNGLPAGEPRVVQAHGEWLFDLTFNSNGSLLATGGGDNRIVVWDAATLQPVTELNGHTDDVHAVAFADGDRRLASAGDDMTVRIWDLASKSQLHALAGHTDTIPALAISPDGQTLASGSRDGHIRLWNVANGELIDLLQGHADDVMSVAFHAGGDILVSASYDHTVRLWDLAASAPSQMLEHDDWLYAVATTEEGTIVTGGRDCGLRLWDEATGTLLAEHRQQKNIARIVPSPSGLLIAIASADGAIRFWDRSLTQVIDTVRLDPGEPGVRQLIASGRPMSL